MKETERQLDAQEIYGVSLFQESIRRFLRNKLAIFGGIVVVFFCFSKYSCRFHRSIFL